MAFVEPRTTFFSEFTQEQDNFLPQFHPGRRLRSSNWAQLVNALDGTTLEDYTVQAARAFRNQYLRTVHLDEPDLLCIVDLPAGLDLNPLHDNLNLIRNGSFELRSRPDKVADWWEHTGTVAVQATTLFGAVSPALTPASSETAAISQTIRTDPWNVGEARTFSAWYRIDSWAGGTKPATTHGLIVTVTYGDGSTEDFIGAFETHTSGQWRRVTLTVAPTRAVVTYTVKLETTRSALFDITEAVHLDAIQAEQNATATIWQPNIFDGPHWFESDQLSPIHFDTTAPIFLTNSLRDFFYEAVPLRATLHDIRTVASDADRRGGIGEAVDFHKLRWAFTWDVDPDTNTIRRIGLDPEDIYGSFDLSFYTGTADGARYEEGVSGLTYRCVAGFQRWLWVIHEMLVLNGENRVVLSIVDSRVPFPAPDHYETQYSLILPLPVGLDYHNAQFKFEDPQHLYVSTATHEYVLRLYYDYAIIDALAFQVLFRERYDSLALVR